MPGTMADIDILRTFGPKLGVNRKGLTDKAYFGHDDCVYPYKKPQNGGLSELREDWNTVLSWWRATNEHVNAQVNSCVSSLSSFSSAFFVVFHR